MLLLFKKTGASSPSIPALTDNGIADVGGSARMYPGYTGPLRQVFCASATPTTLDIPQTATGREDWSVISTWTGAVVSQIYDNGWYWQKSGNLEAVSTAGKRPLFKNSIGSGSAFTGLSSLGYADTGSLDAGLDQGIPSPALTGVDRNNMSMFVVCRHMGSGFNSVIMAAETSAPGNSLFLFESQPAGGGQGDINISGSSNLGTKLLATAGQLSLIGMRTGASNGVKLWVNERSYTNATNMTSSTIDKVHAGRGLSAANTRSSHGDYAAMIIHNKALSDAEVSTLHSELRVIFPDMRQSTRTNVCLITPNSLSFDMNGSVFNKSTAYYTHTLMSKQCDFVMMAVSGRKISDQIAQFSDITNISPDILLATKLHVIVAPIVNDVQGKTGTGGIGANITAAATAIYNDCVTFAGLLTALGGNVTVSFELNPTVGASFWTGTAQDQADKPQIYLEAQNLMAASLNCIDNRSITVSRPSGDPVHFDAAGNAYRAVLWASKLDSIF